MRRFLLPLLFTAFAIHGFAALPESGVVLPGIDEDSAREILSERALQPLEGIWHYPDEGIDLIIERYDGERDIAYRMVLLSADDLDLVPGMVMGYIASSAVDNKYRLWLYSERDRLTLCSPLECVATFDGKSTLTFDPPHWDVKVRVNFARFLPTLFRGVSVLPQAEKEKLPQGFRKIYPADGNGERFSTVRYL